MTSSLDPLLDPRPARSTSFAARRQPDPRGHQCGRAAGRRAGVLALARARPTSAVAPCLVAAGAIVVKGFVIPRLLHKAMREAAHPARGRAVRRLHPLAPAGRGRHRAGGPVRTDAAAGRRAHRHRCSCRPRSRRCWTGFLMLTTRRKAITQVLGYLVLENGIFMFGLLLLEAMPFLVEVGVLLDLFVGVFVMGIIIHHINREFAVDRHRPAVGAEGMNGWLLRCWSIVPLAARRPSRSWCRRTRWRPWLLPLAAVAHLALVTLCVARAAARRRRLDGLAGPRSARARSFLGFVSLLFFLCALYAPGYLALRPERPQPRLLRLPARLPGDDDAGDPVAPPRPDVGGDGSDHAVVALRCSTSTTTPARWRRPGSTCSSARSGIALALLGSFFLAYAALKAGLESSLLFDDLVARRAAACRRRGCTPPSSPVRRLRHQDGPGADAHLEAGRLRRGAGHRGRAARRRGDELRVPGDPAVLSDLPRRGRRRVRPRAADLHGAALDGASPACSWSGQRDFKRMLAYSSVEHMGILVLGIGIGGLAHVRRAAAPDQQRPDQGRAVPLGRQHPPGLREQAHRRRRGRPPARAALGRAVPRGLPRHHRLAAVRARSSASSRSSTPPSPAGSFVAGGLFLLLLAVVFIGMGATVLRGGAGRAVGGGQGARLPRAAAHRRPGRWPFSRWCCSWASTSRAPLSALLREAAAFLEAQAMSDQQPVLTLANGAAAPRAKIPRLPLRCLPRAW